MRASQPTPTEPHRQVAQLRAAERVRITTSETAERPQLKKMAELVAAQKVQIIAFPPNGYRLYDMIGRPTVVRDLYT